MKATKKPRADSKLKNLPQADQETLWLLMHPTDKDTPAYTLEAAAVHCLEELALSVSLSTLSEWHSWFALARRMEAAAQRANQTAIELARNSDLTPADIERVAQTVFTAETLEAGNVKAYVALAKLRLESRKLDLDQQKFRLLEAKAQRLDALEAKAKEIHQAGGLSAETLEMLEKQLKLL